MGTKNNPGNFDPSLEKLDDDEPFFILTGKDPCAALTIRFWALLRASYMNEGNRDVAKIKEANTCANACEQWAVRVGRGDMAERLEKAWRTVLILRHLDDQQSDVDLVQEFVATSLTMDSVRPPAPPPPVPEVTP